MCGEIQLKVTYEHYSEYTQVLGRPQPSTLT